MKKFIVISSWESTYPNPIILKAGDEVIVDKSIIDDNPEWCGWVWCISANNSGWVPHQIIVMKGALSDNQFKAEITTDYSANELSVEVGEVLEGDQSLNDWTWCHKIDDIVWGWVPDMNIENYPD